MAGDPILIFDHRAFRRALSQFPTGVAVVTACTDADTAIGMTMSSFNSVSLDPPLVLFSVARSARSLPAMLAAKGYAVNVLSREQEALSNQFAKSLGDKWNDVKHSLGYAQSPLIHDALAHFECEPYAHHDGGDHVIFIGRVVRFAAREDYEPLVFFRGNYHNISMKDRREPEWPLPMHY